MEVSWHADERLVIISLWHGSVCRATFRMPVEESPALIQALGNALGDAVRVQSTQPRATPQLTLRRDDEPLWYGVPEITMLPERRTES